MSFYDFMFVLSATLFNLLIAAIFIAQKNENDRLVKTFGIAWLLLGIPLLIVFIEYLGEGKSVDLMAAFLFVLIYMVVELLLDYVFKYDFRAKHITHIPYILLEYVALFSLVVLSFDISQIWGAIVSVCFWILMGSLVYLYWDKIKPQNSD